MTPDHSAGGALNGVERVRRELLAALHIGRLGPGDQVPSVRRLADETGMNRKTVHRAYRRLADEGLLDLRPGSGTFIAERIGGSGSPASIADLLVAVNRSRAIADSVGLTPAVFASFLDIRLASGFRGVPVTVSECNREQLGLIELDLRSTLGLDVHPRLLAEIPRLPQAAILKTEALITTDCHATELAEMVANTDRPVYRIALDPEFPRQIAERARRGSVLMVVRDSSFAPVFLRFLEQLSVPTERIRRIHVHEPHEARARLWDLDADSTLHVSPLLEGAWGSLPSGRFRRLSGHWKIEAASLDRLRAALALELANRRRVEPSIRRAPDHELRVHPS